MTGISDYGVQVFFVLGIPHNSERDWSLHFDVLHTLLCRSIHASFVKFVLLFSLHYETTRAQFILKEYRR